MSYNPRGRGDRGGYSPRGGSDGRGRGRGTYDIVDRSRGGGGSGGRGGPETRGRGGPEVRGGRGGGYDRPRGGGREPAVSQEVLFEGKAVPPPNVGPFEDNCVVYNKEHHKPDAALPFRPDYGTKGRAIVLRANFHEISFHESAKFYSYRIALKPDAPRRDTKRVFWKLMNESPFKDLSPTTDGSTEIVTLRKLPQIKDIEMFLDVEGNGRGDGHGANLRKKYTVKISEGGVIDQARLIRDLRNKTVQGKIVDEDVIIRALNIVMAKQPYNDEGTVITGKTRNKYFWIDGRKQSANLGGGLECIRGFYSSVRLSAGRILLNLNVNHSAFFATGDLSQLIRDFWRVFGPDNQLLNRYIKGVRVEITHLPKVKNEKGELAYRQKSIWGLATMSDGRKGANPPRVKEYGATPEGVMFFVQDHTDDKSGKPGKPGKSGNLTGRWVTVAQYFDNQYGMRLGNFPVVNTGSLDKPTYQPVDVCRILPGQICNGELGTSQRQAIIGFSCRRPPDNYMTIKTNGLKMIGSTDAMGLRVLPDLVAVHGRVLNAPTLRYKTKSETPKFGSWNLRGQVFCKGVTVSNWGVLVIHATPNPPDPASAVDLLKRVSNGLGLLFTSKPRTVNVLLGQKDPKDPNGPRPSLRSQLDGLFTRAKENGFQLALVLLPGSEESVFSDVKYAGDVRHGLLTHCCLTDKFIRGNDQYMANNAMKINLKLGGVNQTLDQPRTSRLIDAGKTMVVGLDVTHPSATDPQEFPSIACIVASIDKQLGQWPGEAQVQNKKVEKIEKLPTMLKSCLLRWRAANNQQLPDNILVYRDGVSEGQFEMVAKEEYDDMRIATSALYRKPPPITIIVCGKRHNVRFFPTTKGDVDRTSNPLNGTVVDRGITRPILWDFYLQAQSPLQGSARPAHYVVVRDEIFTNPRIVTEGRPSDVVQELTHSICYMMGRCTRSISYSTPAFLADRFCDRARRYIRSEFKRQADLQKEEALANKRSVEIRLTAHPDMVQIHNQIANRMVYI